MTKPRPPRGVGLLIPSLDSEVALTRAEFEFTALVHSLFARRVALADSHALDNAQVQTFFHDNWDLLAQEPNQITDSRAMPLFGTCGKAGADVWRAVDLYLLPKGPRGAPTYLSSLSPMQNRRLRRGYERLSSPSSRRTRLLETVGQQYETHVQHLVSYFGAHPGGVVPRKARTGLFGCLRTALTSLDNARLLPLERDLIGRMIETMDGWREADGYQSRERLHEAIYDGRTPPRVWRGKPQPVRYRIDDPAVRHSWRMFIDALYNLHHADTCGLDALGTPHLGVPESVRRLAGGLSIKQLDVREVPLEASIYPPLFDLKFALGVRQTKSFWDSLDGIEQAKDPAARESLWSEHLKFISSQFARHLIDVHKRRDLVYKSLAQIRIGETNARLVYGTLAVALVAALYGFPEVALGAFATERFAEGLATVCIERLFGPQEVEHPSFRSFMAEVGATAGVFFGAQPSDSVRR